MRHMTGVDRLIFSGPYTLDLRSDAIWSWWVKRFPVHVVTTKDLIIHGQVFLYYWTKQYLHQHLILRRLHAWIHQLSGKHHSSALFVFLLHYQIASCSWALLLAVDTPKDVISQRAYTPLKQSIRSSNELHSRLISMSRTAFWLSAALSAGKLSR